MALYEKHKYLNKDIEYLISKEIIEYDMKSAGFNIIKRFKLLDQSQINKLEDMSREGRQITIGLIQRSDKEFTKELNSKFVQMRKEFFEANSLSDDEVLSIKKDAVITLRRCRNTEFDNIVFAEKNIYSSYYYLAKNEFYLGAEGLDVKGISNERLKLHTDYMIDYLTSLFKMFEVTTSDRVIKQIIDFSYYYKRRELEIGYYRELNHESLFRLHESFMDETIGIKHTNTLQGIDISFNYLNYIVPLINVII